VQSHKFVNDALSHVYCTIFYLRPVRIKKCGNEVLISRKMDGISGIYSTGVDNSMLCGAASSLLPTRAQVERTNEVLVCSSEQ
jgi:hypothetical protein